MQRRGKNVPFHDRTKRAFSKSADPRVDAIWWLEQVQADWREAEKALSRTLTLLAAAALGFLVVIGGEASEFSVAGLKVSDMALVALALAVLFAYLYSSALGLLSEVLFHEDAFESLVRFTYPGAADEDLHALLYPPNSFLMTTQRLAEVRSVKKSRVGMFLGWLIIGKLLLMLIAPLVFLVYAFGRLYDFEPLPTGLTITATVIAAALALSNWPTFITTMQVFQESKT